MSKDHKTALITGSGQNIGRGIAHHLATAGFNIILNGSSDKKAAESVASEVRAKGGTPMVAMGDVGDKATAEQIVMAGLEYFGAIDVLSTIPQSDHMPRFLEINEADWQRVIDVDLNAAVWLSRMVLPKMISKGWGRIISFPAWTPNAVIAHHLLLWQNTLYGADKVSGCWIWAVWNYCKHHFAGTFPGDDPASAKNLNLLNCWTKINPTPRNRHDIGAMVGYPQKMVGLLMDKCCRSMVAWSHNISPPKKPPKTDSETSLW